MSNRNKNDRELLKKFYQGSSPKQREPLKPYTDVSLKKSPKMRGMDELSSSTYLQREEEKKG